MRNGWNEGQSLQQECQQGYQLDVFPKFELSCFEKVDAFTVSHTWSRAPDCASDILAPLP